VLGITAVFVAFAFQPGHAQARAPSTTQERERFVTLVRSLESEPLAANANATRQQLRNWMIEVPDIRFKVCNALLGGAADNEYRYSREINLQVALSGAVLTLERPGEARDDVAVYTAGVDGALRAYQVLVKSTPDTRLAVLDHLITQRGRGDLRAHVARLANENCPRSNALLIAALIGALVGLMLALLLTH
jgi:hypothetical protein